MPAPKDPIKRAEWIKKFSDKLKRWAIQKGLPQEPTHPTPYPAYKMSDLDLSTILGEGPVFKKTLTLVK